SMCPSPTSSRAASTPCAETVSRWTRGIPRASRYTARAASIDSTATPTWSTAESMSARLAARGVDRGGGGHGKLADPGGRGARHVAHDPVDVGSLEHFVGQQGGGQLIEVD